MLRNLNPEKYDLACIQEPFLNTVGLANASNLRRFWDVIYPTNHHSNPERSQTILLVNKKLSKNNWHIIPLDTPNITAIEIHGDFGKYVSIISTMLVITRERSNSWRDTLS
jgi:hypothetical protein